MDPTVSGKKKINVAAMAKIGMLSGLAVVLMLFEIPLWFAPGFYKMDLSEVVVAIGAFSMGPVAGIIIEAIKVLLNLVINGTITGGVGELANFVIGCCFIVPAALLYRHKKNLKNAILGLCLGTVLMAACGGLVNAYILLPAYCAAFGWPMEQIISMGNAVNGSITNLTTFIFWAVVPFNLVKGIVSSALTLLLYKRVSPILHKN